ncbi:MAG: hypothetical protein ACRDZY_12805 [Acidimicrobiales bacterium]
MTETETPHEGVAPPNDELAAELEPVISAWRAEIDGQVSVSASDVQDRLLDLWRRLPEGEVRAGVERWLTETLERSLYAVSDVDARLDQVVADA